MKDETFEAVRDTIEEQNRLILGKQEKYTYYLLSISAASIAFAMHITKNEALSWSHLLLGIALFLWVLSFYSGCKVVDKEIFLQTINIKFMATEHPSMAKQYGVGNTAKSIKIGQELFKTESTEKTTYMDHQFKFLYSGGAVFVLWHILNMYLLIP